MIKCRIVTGDGECLEEFKVKVAPVFIIYRGRLLMLDGAYNNAHNYIEQSYLELS